MIEQYEAVVYSSPRWIEAVKTSPHWSKATRHRRLHQALIRRFIQTLLKFCWLQEGHLGFKLQR
jgi:hypothetical protein